MRKYNIYLIEEEFANHYFGREKMFFSLFSEYNTSIGYLRDILTKQINYITNPIPVLKINQFVISELNLKSSIGMDNESYTIQALNKKSKATLYVTEEYLTLVGIGEYEAEMNFFELLRKWDSRFLAVDTKEIRFGWLTPIKQRNFV